MSSLPFINEVKEGLILDLIIQPNAAKTELVGIYQDRLKIKLSSPPVDGKANKQLIKYLSSLFSISKSCIPTLN